MEEQKSCQPDLPPPKDTFVIPFLSFMSLSTLFQLSFMSLSEREDKEINVELVWDE